MDFIDIISWNAKVEKAFVEAKSTLPKYEKELSIILDVLGKGLSYEEREKLETRKRELSETINDLLNDTSMGFYLMEAQDILQEHNKLSVKPVKIAFMKKDRESTDEIRELSKIFLNLIEKYNKILNLELPNLQPTRKQLTCSCGNNKEFEIIDGRLVYCQKCGNQVKEKISSKPSFKDSDRIDVSSKYKYTRKIHFHNCARQYQGKQKVRIPVACYKDVREQLALNGILTKKINPQHIRGALQETGWTDQYENAVLIWSNIAIQKCPDISHLEELVFNDFTQIEQAYNIITGDPDEERSSFMSYPYVLYQDLECRHNWKCDINFFNILKSDDRIDWLDDTMEQIFMFLEWSGFKRLGGSLR